MNLKDYLESLQDRDLRSIEDVRQVLDKLDDLLPGSELPALRYFNHAYFIITSAVEEQRRHGKFQDVEFLNKFDTTFAWYYLEPLRNYLRRSDVPPAWQAAFDYCRTGNGKPVRALALGVNAHVNNDIPQVLHACGVRPGHKNDYLLVNHIIDTTISSIQTSVSIKKRLVRLYYQVGMRAIIRLWRRNAWLKAVRLQQKEWSKRAVEKRALWISHGAHKFPLL